MEHSDARPMSHWSKTAILEECRYAGIPESSMDVLRRMNLPDIRATCLVRDSVRETGMLDSLDGRWRHTQFWCIDFDFVCELGGDPPVSGRRMKGNPTLDDFRGE